MGIRLMRVSADDETYISPRALVFADLPGGRGNCRQPSACGHRRLPGPAVEALLSTAREGGDGKVKRLRA
jgi:hypothetical protein